MEDNPVNCVDARDESSGPVEDGRALAVFNCDAESVARLAPALARAEAVTVVDRSAACACLDRGIRCVELADPETAERIHAALKTAMLERRSGPRPAVSVVVPLFNTLPDFLRDTIGSVLGQDDPDWELILLDDGDPARTGPIVAEFPDPRIRYYGDLGPRGIAMGRNLGNLLARGRLIAVLDHDDLCAPERVRALKAVTDREAIIYTDIIHRWPDGRREDKRLADFSADDVRRDCNIFHPAVAYAWETAAAAPYDPRFEPADDYRFYLTALRQGRRLAHVKAPLTIYRWHGGQHSKMAGARQLALSAGARGEDRYLRGGGDPLDRARRFEPTLLALLAHGCDQEARELADLGYGPEHLRLRAQGAATKESPIMRQTIWLTLRHEGEKAAAGLIRAGIEQGRLGPVELCDLVDLLMRIGDLATARAEMERLRMEGLPALGRHREFLLEQWAQRLGAGGQVPPRLTLGPAKANALEATVIRSAAGGNEGEQWNQGLAEADREFVAFGRAGDTWSPEWLADAAARLRRDAGLDVILGQVMTPAGETLPGRTIGPAAIFRGERALLCGCVFRREALARIGGFIPGLGEACGWELMVRAITRLIVVQSELVAARTSYLPLPADVPGERARFRERQALGLLVKDLHRPLRALDLTFSGADPEWLAERLARLGALLARSPGLVPYLDPWEYLGEGTDAGHLLYRTSQRLGRHGLKALARAAAAEALRELRYEPKVWAQWLRSWI